MDCFLVAGGCCCHWGSIGRSVGKICEREDTFSNHDNMGWGRSLSRSNGGAGPLEQESRFPCCHRFLCTGSNPAVDHVDAASLTSLAIRRAFTVYLTREQFHRARSRYRVRPPGGVRGCLASTSRRYGLKDFWPKTSRGHLNWRIDTHAFEPDGLLSFRASMRTMSGWSISLSFSKIPRTRSSCALEKKMIALIAFFASLAA